MKPKAFLTRQLPPRAMQMLQANFELSWNQEDRVLTKEELIAGVAGKEALFCLLTDQIDAEVMDAAPLRVISNYAVGFNNIDVAAATTRGIPVCNTPGVLTESTADCAFLLMLAVARRAYEGEALTRAGKFEGWGPLMLLGADIYGKTLGLVGMGRIAEAVAKRARGFDMEVIYYNRSKKESSYGTQTDLNTLLQTADFVSLHVPLTSETTHLIGEKELNLMKPTAYLINTARGPVIDEKALVRALQAGTIGGAGLDVFEEEPKLAQGLTECPNTFLLPHLGSATIETRTAMGVMAVENGLAVLEGGKPHSVANPEVLPSHT